MSDRSDTGRKKISRFLNTIAIAAIVGVIYPWVLLLKWVRERENEKIIEELNEER